MTDRVDWNDLHVEAGLDSVAAQLMSALGRADARSVAKGEEPPAPDDLPPLAPADAYADAASEALVDYRPADLDWYKTLTRSKHGQLEGHLGNLSWIFAHDLRWDHVLAYCDFSYRVLFLREPPIRHAEPELQDPDVARMREWFHRHYWTMRPPPRSELQDALIIEAQRHRYHPVRAYLTDESLRHDGVSRIDSWLVDCFDAAGDRDYLRLVGRKFLIGAVARVMQPGCKMDNMLILEGNQGAGKSTALAILFGDWFSDAPIPLGEKDSYQLIQGVWGYEMAELDALSKTESTTAKAFISQRTDRFRPPYGTGVMTFKRQTVFVGTTNQDEYLKDYSGNRRYWPVMCRKVDLNYLRKYRDQLWAEAYAAYEAGAEWWIRGDTEIGLCEAEQETRLARDAWESIIRDWVNDPINRSPYYSAADILIGALSIDKGHIQRAHQNRLSPIMKALGWGKGKATVSSSRINVYTRPEADLVTASTKDETPPW